MLYIKILVLLFGYVTIRAGISEAVYCNQWMVKNNYILL